ncbi:cell wall hydrolase [Candidatus Saccharibacteria bacterium]|nr:cell wall hydrolase [Candidatus Saccharibacteria bacterium]
MKHSTTHRRVRIAMRLTRMKLRRALKKESAPAIGLAAALTMGLSLTLTASALSVSNDEIKAASVANYSSGDMDYNVASPLGAYTVETGKMIGVATSTRANLEAMFTAEVPAMSIATTAVTTTETTTTTATTTTIVTSVEETWSSEPTEIDPAIAVPIAREIATDEEETYEAEVEEAEATEETPAPVEGSVYDYVSEEEIIMLAKTVAQEGGDCSYAQQACVIWTVLNRVDSSKWPNTIAENLTKPAQFAYYPNKVYREEHYQVAYDQVYNWLFGGERYLSSGYDMFYGDGWRNHFYGNGNPEYCPD